MQSTDNLKRADRVYDALDDAYQMDDESDSAITDVLADLRHLCDRDGKDFAALDRVARRHYLAELQEAREEAKAYV